MGYWKYRKGIIKEQKELRMKFTEEELSKYNRHRMFGMLCLVVGLLLTPTVYGLIICAYLAWRNFNKANLITHTVMKRLAKKKRGK